jgi:hypothetical protein
MPLIFLKNALFSKIRRAGIRLALLSLRALFGASAVLALGLLGAGCLITERVEFQELENFPPSIASAPGASHPLDRILRVELDSEGSGDGGLEAILLEVDLRDPNVNQPLQWVLTIDETEYARQTADANGQTSRRLVLEVPAQRLRPVGECHRVELLVSSEFSFSNPPRPVTEGDIASAYWWVEATDADLPTASMDTCRP